MLIGNNSPFMTKTLIAILIKPRLKTVLKNQIILQNKTFLHKLIKKDQKTFFQGKPKICIGQSQLLANY